MVKLDIRKNFTKYPYLLPKLSNISYLIFKCRELLEAILDNRVEN